MENSSFELSKSSFPSLEIAVSGRWTTLSRVEQRWTALNSVEQRWTTCKGLLIIRTRFSACKATNTFLLSFHTLSNNSFRDHKSENNLNYDTVFHILRTGIVFSVNFSFFMSVKKIKKNKFEMPSNQCSKDLRDTQTLELWLEVIELNMV